MQPAQLLKSPSVVPLTAAVPTEHDTIAGNRALYFPTLDGLRFFAFLLVFFHHLPVFESDIVRRLQLIGWVGVHLFFVLSAFLLTAILMQERQVTSRISVFHFYVRRALRIWPLYFSYVIGLVGFLYLRGKTGPDSGPRFLGLLTFTDNILSSLQGFNRFPDAGHLWTLSVEEQFYLLLPIVLVPLLARRRLFVGTLGLLWMIFVVLRIISVANEIPHPFIWTAPFSADALVIGTLLGGLRLSSLRVTHSIAVTIVGCMLFAAGLFTSDIKTVGAHQVYLYALVGVGAAMLTLAALHAPWARWLATPWLRYLGKISFGLYVFHFIGIEIGMSIGGAVGTSNSWAIAVVSLVATVSAAAVSYETFEKRFLVLKRRFETIKTRPV